MKNDRVIFRVDGSVEMGMGHLTRCLTLAGALAEHGARSCFLMRGHAAGLAELVQRNGHAVQLLPDPDAWTPGTIQDGGLHAHWLPTTWQGDAEQTSRAMDGLGPADWLVVDHYALDARWESACRREGLRILAIDDLADRAHGCDILLDQNLVRQMDTRYRDRLPEACVRLLGPRYALLRPDFLAQRRLLTGRSGKIGRILVCYGGSDPTNETARAVRALANLAIPSVAVDVVVGMSNPHVESIARLCSGLPRAEVHRGANNIAELMRQADLSIGAGGVMSWERCCLGLPAVVVDIAANQVGALTALADRGAALYLGAAASVTVEALGNAIGELMDDSNRARALGEAAFALVDGEGRSRVAAACG
ncbi:UDP-2,4-diacetamido-2,4,6-trideoxy-beta-L-altropyranose hydrolase [Bradyrhizobium commune]|uniref:UDP-2,4-diacetamido-2,4, 6-trideoxy-beta-L-altropyranose hydrolase n=1 Tax=Bradyrhizobium commune TaxID=83627 RepID=A0A7S9DA80_9BRAD|nr:UDP-2,4-diacetamido-2,4,6-trideoxy-beta-L-altropyranose hydrolase [Bradyrhizobium commune]QPF93873.1 UDP-2,4-diacetamido-2,4,6-trideoxy-beta-L-altropyranose hydrolase [Bradyrhizobium commune]